MIGNMTTHRFVTTLAFAALLAAASPAAAQPSPYAGHTERDIKALSSEQIDDLLHGRGMGLALAAELNGYPGPKHVLELAAELGLSDEQRAAVARVHDDMQSEAVELGRRTIDAERRLDALFAGGEASSEALRAALEELGDLQAALRHAHLDAHLATKALLTEAQVRRYDELRGYVDGGHGRHDPARHGGHGGHPGH
jgi:Spy/CpxP family protein refolding chaperone